MLGENLEEWALREAGGRRCKECRLERQRGYRARKERGMLIDIWQGDGSAAALIGGRGAEKRAIAFRDVVARETKAFTWHYKDAASRPKHVWAVEALGVSGDRMMTLWLAHTGSTKMAAKSEDGATRPETGEEPHGAGHHTGPALFSSRSSAAGR